MILYLLGRWWGLDSSARGGSGSSSVRAASSPSCCSARARLEGVIDRHLANLLTLAVTLSMAATPLLLLIDDAIDRAR